jgi:hypothetical protein
MARVRLPIELDLLKGKSGQSQVRTAKGPRFLRKAMEDLPQDPTIAGLRIRGNAEEKE